MASSRLAGSSSMPRWASSSGLSVYRFSSFTAPGSVLFSIPSRPAARMAVIARYGLHEPSTVRSSTWPPGTRSIWVRLLRPWVMKIGLQVAPLVGVPAVVVSRL